MKFPAVEPKNRTRTLETPIITCCPCCPWPHARTSRALLHTPENSRTPGVPTGGLPLGCHRRPAPFCSAAKTTWSRTWSHRDRTSGCWWLPHDARGLCEQHGQRLSVPTCGRRQQQVLIQFRVHVARRSGSDRKDMHLHSIHRTQACSARLAMA